MPAKLNAFNTPEFAMPPNYLHIWPKLSYMLIALPNQDASFTCTLFMSQEQFDKIHTPEELIDFFSKEFPDALELIGRENLCHDYFTNPLGSLMSVKASHQNE
jgi:kynurenine 3-monooxygenase